MIFILEAFFSGCISKVINDGKDYSWSKIKSVIYDRHDQNISTKICRVIEKSLNIVTDNTYKNSDKIYDAIEKLFNEFKNHGDTLVSVKCGLNILGIDSSDQRCENFLEKFYEGIRHDDDLYKVIIMDLEQKGIQVSQEEFRKLNEKLDKNHKELIEKLDGINENLNGSSLVNEENITTKKIKFQNNKKQDYIKLWNSRLFLHLDNDERPITLSDAFIVPNYQMQVWVDRIGFPKNATLDEIIDKFVNYNRTSTLLIVGAPGIGKSSVISWMAKKYQYDDRMIILRFRDWESDELENGLLKAIYAILNCKNVDLENKTVVIDGFDEMKLLPVRESLLKSLFADVLDFKNLKFVITSRSDYVEYENFENVLSLLPFSTYNIRKFYQIITKKELDPKVKYFKNKEVLGIPVILYMAIMSNLDITQNATKAELYGRIFAKKGGIFDRFSHEGIAYDEGTQILRNRENIESYLDVLQKIAFKMFEKNDSFLVKEEYQVPKLFFQGEYVSVLEFPIKHLFESTKCNIEFVHKSIYEYFVSEYIFLKFGIINETEKKVVDYAESLAKVLKNNHLSKEICEFLKYRIIKSDLKNKFNVINDVFQTMLKDGMLFYTNETYKNIVKYEMNVFTNMLEIIHLWEFDIVSVKCELINSYLRYNHEVPLNLSRFFFEGANLLCLCLSKANLQNSILTSIKAIDAELEEADLTDAKLQHSDLRFANLRATTLTEANLCDADLTKVNFQDADLINADLRGAKLCKADFRGALLVGANLDDANITDAIIGESQVGYLEKKYNMCGTKVYIEKTREVVRYEKYHKQKR